MNVGGNPEPKVCEVCGREMQVTIGARLGPVDGAFSPVYSHMHTPAQCSLNLISDIRDQLRDVLFELGEIYRRL